MSAEHVVVLDAGTGIRRLGASLPDTINRVDLLLTHLHMDHIQGLGFFKQLRLPGLEVHLWGPQSASRSLTERLTRYLSPPLFPVMLRDLPCNLHIHEVPGSRFDLPDLDVTAEYVVHPGSTVGYRLSGKAGTVAYMPDHEPALGVPDFPREPEWTSGHDLAREVDVLIHDSQYTHEEYESRVGWGHSTMHDMVAFAKLAKVKRLVPFHFDPDRTDDEIERCIADAVSAHQPGFPVTPAAEGASIELGPVGE
jgi:phosphoribosyl 1,2-cyclic phosphodiesterase